MGIGRAFAKDNARSLPADHCKWGRAAVSGRPGNRTLRVCSYCMRSSPVLRPGQGAGMHARPWALVLLMALAEALLALTKQASGLTVKAYDASKVIKAAGRSLLTQAQGLEQDAGNAR